MQQSKYIVASVATTEVGAKKPALAANKATTRVDLWKTNAILKRSGWCRLDFGRNASEAKEKKRVEEEGGKEKTVAYQRILGNA